ncbi:hypothetical protein L1887_20126 [Cichorium endivia]|nr:hypothetical protein L1887_20126 [Cichorium endivia]
MVNGDGERTGDFVWASIWSRAVGYVRNIYAEIVGYPLRLCSLHDALLHLRDSITPFARTNRSYISRGREDGPMDDSAALRVRLQLSDRQVSSGAE